jgi:ATP-dependent Clp protease ATP-binding subunit ClpX
VHRFSSIKIILNEVEFTITDEALDFIVNKALEYKLGARGLRSLCEAILTDAMYELSSDDKILVIDEGTRKKR